MSSDAKIDEQGNDDAEAEQSNELSTPPPTLLDAQCPPVSRRQRVVKADTPVLKLRLYTRRQDPAEEAAENGIDPALLLQVRPTLSNLKTGTDMSRSLRAPNMPARGLLRIQNTGRIL